MSISKHSGMETYERILQETRASGRKVGPQHYAHDKQYRRWEARQSNLKQLDTARESKKVNGELRKARVSIHEAREALAKSAKRIVKQVDQEAQLRDKHEDLKRQKIANGYKSIIGDVSHIKSVGNGL